MKSVMVQEREAHGDVTRYRHAPTPAIITACARREERVRDGNDDDKRQNTCFLYASR